MEAVLYVSSAILLTWEACGAGGWWLVADGWWWQISGPKKTNNRSAARLLLTRRRRAVTSRDVQKIADHLLLDNSNEVII